MGRVTDPVEQVVARRSHLVDLAPLRQSPSFARLWTGNAISGIGSQMTVVAVGLHIYDITGSTFAVSLVGAFALLPMIVAGLYGGMLADAFDRRRVAFLAAVFAWISTIALAAIAFAGVETVWPFYLLTTVNAVAATIVGTVRASIVPRVVSRELLPAAAALTGISAGVMVTVGPALAGVLVASVGFAWTYTIDVVLFLAAFVGILSLPPVPPEGELQKPGLASLKYGMSFLRTAPNVRMSFIVDIIAMTFGQPRVLFPAVGTILLGGGAITVGILTASYALGALVSSLFSGRTGQVRMQGIAIERSIVVYGGFVLGFGVVLAVAASGVLPPVSESIDGAHLPAVIVATLMLVGAGAADNISSIFRQTLLQSAVPDNMRGRLQGVFTVVVTGGPRIGDIYVGLLATVGALWLPPLLGGVVIMVLVAAVVRIQRTFRRYDALAPTP